MRYLWRFYSLEMVKSVQYQSMLSKQEYLHRLGELSNVLVISIYVVGPFGHPTFFPIFSTINAMYMYHVISQRFVLHRLIIWHVNNIPTMQFFTGISRNTLSKSYIYNAYLFW